MRRQNDCYTVPIYTYRYNTFRKSWEVIEHFYVIERFEVIKAFKTEAEAEKFSLDKTKQSLRRSQHKQGCLP